MDAEAVAAGNAVAGGDVAAGPGDSGTCPAPCDPASADVDGGVATVTSTSTGQGGTTTSTGGSTTTTRPPAPVRNDGVTLSQGAVRPGGKVSFSAVGFKPRSTVRVELHSDPVLLTTLTAGGDGTVSAEITIPASAPAGEHHVVASGTGPDGKSVERAAPLVLDLTPPEILSASATPASVAPGQTITFSARFTDARGVVFAGMNLWRSGSTNPVQWPCGNYATLTAGTPQDGTWSLSCKVPDVVASGAYEVGPYGRDELNNNTFTGPKAAFTITGGVSDSTPPAILSASATPASVSPGQTITFSARFTDARGVVFAGMNMWRSGSTNPVQWPCGNYAALTGGTAQDGTWSLTCTVPDTVASGSYEIGPYGRDDVGNMTPAGPRASFTISGGVDDSTAPQIEWVTATPASVSPGQTITFSARFTDAGGVVFAGMNMWRSGGTTPLQMPCGNYATLTSGTAQDGIWSLTCTIPDLVNPGTYEVGPYGRDEVGNHIYNGPKATFTIG